MLVVVVGCPNCQLAVWPFDDCREAAAVMLVLKYAALIVAAGCMAVQYGDDEVGRGGADPCGRRYEERGWNSCTRRTTAAVRDQLPAHRA